MSNIDHHIHATILPHGRLSIDPASGSFKTSARDWTKFTGVKRGKHATDGWSVLTFFHAGVLQISKFYVTSGGADFIENQLNANAA